MRPETTIKLASTDLATRYAARHVAAQIREAALSGQVIVDLSEVFSISDAYADEVFGVLTFVYGLDWLLSRVRVHANDEVLHAIAAVVERRADESRQNRESY